MLNLKTHGKMMSAALALFLFHMNSDVQAQVQIGGPQGVVIGGGMGLRIGGRTGVQFGGGQGARFGPPRTGVQFGGGQGARFGPTETGVQFGGGQGAKFGALQFGGQGNNGAMQGGQYGAPAATYTGSGQNNRMVLRLSPNAKKRIEYSLNGTPFQMAPGNETVLQQGQQWTLAYTPAPGQESRTLQINTAGTYEFNEGENGWTLDANETPTANRQQANRPNLTPRGKLNEPILAAPLVEPSPPPVAEAPKPTVISPTPPPAEDVPTPTKNVTSPTKDVEKIETGQERSILEWNQSKKAAKQKDK